MYKRQAPLHAHPCAARSGGTAAYEPLFQNDNILHAFFGKVVGDGTAGDSAADDNHLSALTPVSYTHLDVYKRQGYGFVPVISFNVLGMERNPGFKLTLSMLHRMLYAVTYGDLIMALKNQCRPYELNPGDSDRLTEEWTLSLIHI